MQIWQLQEPLTITRLSELYFRFRRFVLLLQTKKAISMDCGSCTSSWKPWRWVRLELILTMSDIYINSNLNPLTKFTSSRSTEFKDILPWNISQMIMETIPISTRIVISYVKKQGILFCVYWKVNGNRDNNMIRISLWQESHCRTNTSIRRNKEIQKSSTVRITVRDPSRKGNHLSKVIWDREIITEFTRSISSTRVCEPVLMMDVKVSKDKHISRWVDRENLIYVRWNRIKNRA